MGERDELPTLQNVTLIVADLPAAKDFFVGKLGLRLLTEFPGDYCSIEAGPGVQFGLHVVHAEHNHAVETRGAEFSFLVDDVVTWHQRLTDAGVEFVRPPARTPWGTIEAYFTDPDGHVITLKSVDEP
jgi:catechol 2,3-dioxygenase-like lactoylglutathione lyase family enzyme